MIVDIFNEVFTKIKTTITTATVISEYPDDIPRFPCIVVQEIYNNTDLDTIDSSGENYNVVAFDINIYSNATNKRTVCRNLRNSVDAIMSDYYKMTRYDSGELSNFADLDVYRYNLKYNFKINDSKKIYRG